MSKHIRTAAGLLLALVLLVALVQPAWAQNPITRMRNVAISILTVSNGLTTDDLTVTDDVSVVDDVTVAGSVAVMEDLRLVPATVITLTSGATLTPLGSYQPLASAGAIGFGAISAGNAGDTLVLVNTVNQTITITDSATLRLGGNAALGQYDTLTLIYANGAWTQLSKADN